MKTLKNGCREVRLVLAPDVIAFAETQWRARGYFSVEDYLNTLLNTAVFQDQTRVEEAAASPEPGSVFEDDPESVFAPAPARRRKHASMIACKPQEPLF